jgi:hypothetical protein
MPNNASARRDKDKKKKDKKKKNDNKKTDTPPLHKEDTASAETNSLSLSFEEQQEQIFSFALDRMEKAIQEHATEAIDWEDSDWSWAGTALLVQHSRATTFDERVGKRRKLREEIRKSNQLVSREELKSLVDKAMLRAALEWRRNEPQRKKDSLLLSSALAERKKKDELLVSGPAQDALLAEFDRSLTMAESGNLYAEVKEANPNASAKELGKALRAFKVQAAFV